MRIYQEADYAAMSRRCANLISAEVIRKPDCVLGLATGSTPVGIYHQLAEWNRKGDLSFWDVITVNLDEYRGLAPTHTQSYRDFMQKNLFDHIDIRQENTYVPNGMADVYKRQGEISRLGAAQGGSGTLCQRRAGRDGKTPCGGL